MTIHEKYDLLYYLAFFAGQCIFVLKLADTASRGHNGITSRSEYIAINWVPLMIRLLGEGAFIYFPYRHYNPADIIAYFSGWHPTFALPQGAIPCMFLGYISDSLMDWLTTSNKIPVWMQTWIKAIIPPVPQGVIAHVHTDTTVVPTDPNVPVTATHTDAAIVAPLPESTKP